MAMQPENARSSRASDSILQSTSPKTVETPHAGAAQTRSGPDGRPASPAPQPSSEAGAPSAQINGAARGRLSIQTQFSAGFGEWLIRERVGLVCSTYQTGHLIFIGVRPDGLPAPSGASFSRAMGIAATDQRIYVGTKSEIWRMENFLRPNELEDNRSDRFFVPRTAHITGDINIHELAVEASGRLVFANTRFSCLATLSQSQAFKPLWKPKFISRLAPEDRCHLNGLALEAGQARYVTCCSTGDAVESWRGPEQQRGGGVLIDVASDALVAEGLAMPHSPRVKGEAIYLVESGRGALVRIDRQRRRLLPRLCPRPRLRRPLRDPHHLSAAPDRRRGHRP
jgi:uncharacterized protein (TIGR03032 family)